MREVTFLRVDSVEDQRWYMLSSTRDAMWEEIVPWLDKSCPSWGLAYENERKNPLLRRGHYTAFRTNVSAGPQPIKLRMAPKEAVLFIMFWSDRALIKDMGTFSVMGDEIRKIGARLCRYEGPWHEYPIELHPAMAKEAMEEYSNELFRCM